MEKVMDHDYRYNSSKQPHKMHNDGDSKTPQNQTNNHCNLNMIVLVVVYIDGDIKFYVELENLLMAKRCGKVGVSFLFTFHLNVKI